MAAIIKTQNTHSALQFWATITRQRTWILAYLWNNKKNWHILSKNTKGGKQKRSIGQGVGWWRIITPHLRAAANAMMMTETRRLEQQQQQQWAAGPQSCCVFSSNTQLGACCQEFNGTNSGWSSYPSPPSSPFSVFSSNTQGVCFQDLIPIREDHHEHHQHSRSL